MHANYSSVKVNNEIELCEISEPECKNLIERELLKNRISYFIRWYKPHLFSRREVCIVCIHDDAKELAENIVRTVCDESGYNVRFLMKRSHNVYL